MKLLFASRNPTIWNPFSQKQRPASHRTSGPRRAAFRTHWSFHGSRRLGRCSTMWRSSGTRAQTTPTAAAPAMTAAPSTASTADSIWAPPSSPTTRNVAAECSWAKRPKPVRVACNAFPVVLYVKDSILPQTIVYLHLHLGHLADTFVQSDNNRHIWPKTDTTIYRWRDIWIVQISSTHNCYVNPLLVNSKIARIIWDVGTCMWVLGIQEGMGVQPWSVSYPINQWVLCG